MLFEFDLLLSEVERMYATLLAWTGAIFLSLIVMALSDLVRSKF
jgi:hypothetical protein